MKFVDEALIDVIAGDGGNGCVSFRHEKYKEFGGPNGGDGGRGGHVFAEAVENLNSLIDFRYQQHYSAKNGRPGEGSNRTGADGADMIISVDCGIGSHVEAEHCRELGMELIVRFSRLEARLPPGLGFRQILNIFCV